MKSSTIEILGLIVTLASLAFTLFLEWPRFKTRLNESKGEDGLTILAGINGLLLLFPGIIAAGIGLWQINFLQRYDGLIFPISMIMVSVGGLPIVILEWTPGSWQDRTLLAGVLLLLVQGIIGVYLVRTGHGEPFLKFFDSMKEFRK